MTKVTTNKSHDYLLDLFGKSVLVCCLLIILLIKNLLILRPSKDNETISKYPDHYLQTFLH